MSKKSATVESGTSPLHALPAVGERVYVRRISGAYEDVPGEFIFTGELAFRTSEEDYYQIRCVKPDPDNQYQSEMIYHCVLRRLSSMPWATRKPTPTTLSAAQPPTQQSLFSPTQGKPKTHESHSRRKHVA